MRPGLHKLRRLAIWAIVLSVLAHVMVLWSGLLSFSSSTIEAAPAESLPVDIISPSDFSRMVAGQKTAKKVSETPKPLVEKVAEQKVIEDEKTKVVEKKPEIKTASAEAAPPPVPETKPKETKVEEKKPAPKPDPIAEALKKEEVKKKDPPKPKPAPQKPQPKLDLSEIETKLANLDKRQMRREAAAGAELNPVASAGVTNSTAASLSQNEIDALRNRLSQCWDVPIGQAQARDLKVIVRIQFRRDGSLAAEPTLINHMPHPSFQAAADSAIRAVIKCAPYSFMPVAKYDTWKDLEFEFDPREMYRG
jgi:colicin import membrane protein